MTEQFIGRGWAFPLRTDADGRHRARRRASRRSRRRSG